MIQSAKIDKKGIFPYNGEFNDPNTCQFTMNNDYDGGKFELEKSTPS